jgi:regulator of sigma E protease
MSYVLAILALGVLIIVHEGGHYFVARWSGMRVEKFSLGFGPALIKWRHAGTQFQIAPIPFGGFVHITGMNPHEEFNEKDPSVYPNRPTILRFLTIFAGPFTNLLFASVIMFVVNTVAGPEFLTDYIKVVSLEKGSPADGNFVPGDIIETVDGEPVRISDKVGFPQRVQASQGKPLTVTVRRDGEVKTISVTPKQTPAGNYLIGVGFRPAIERRSVGVLESGYQAVRYPVVKSKEILAGLWDMVTGKTEPDAVSTIGMVAIISDQIREGWIVAFEFLAMLNVYLGLFNLLPLPALDGGRLVFLGYELATRRRPNPKVEAAVHMAGFAVLFVVMILVMFKDIKHYF